MPVPQAVQVPFIAGRPFFMVTFLASFMFCLALHFTQYAVSAMISSPELMVEL